MRFVIQRVKHASVTVGGEVVGRIGRGYMVLVGVCDADDEAIADKMVNKMINLRNLLMLLPAAALCAGGYYLYEGILYGNFAAPLAGIPTNLVQSVASAIVFVAVAHTFDRFHVSLSVMGNQQ